VIEEVLTGIELINSSEEEGLKALISDDVVDAELYRRNFVTLTRAMAPDGERISFIGFTSRGKTVGLTRLHSDIEYIPEILATGTEVTLTPMTIEGELDHALRREQRGVFRRFVEVRTEKGEIQQIIVDEGMIDVVRSYFGQMVEVKGMCARDDKGRVNIHLKDIRALDT
jgi:hypothetical protein